jgi:hypothetical protein
VRPNREHRRAIPRIKGDIRYPGTFKYMGTELSAVVEQQFVEF